MSSGDADATDGPQPLRAAVFASGSGSNFQALLDAEAGIGEGEGSGSGDAPAPWTTVLLVSDREGSGAADRARRAGVDVRVVPVKGREARAVEAETVALLEAYGVQVVFLAGYLRLVPAGVVRRYPRRILNIHPALLPAFGGKGMWGRHVHQAVLDAGVRITGPTVHFADDAYDRGDIVAQWPVPVLPDDTPEALAARVLEVEHGLYPRVARHVCQALQRGEEPGPLPPRDRAFGPTPSPTP